MNFLNKKRKQYEISISKNKENIISSEELSIQNFLSQTKRQKMDKNKLDGNPINKVKIKLKDMISIDKGYFNLPKEVIEECLALNFKVHFKTKKDNGNLTYYYECDHEGCQYRLKILENPTMTKDLTLTALISNFKSFDLLNASELENGICHITVYGEHKDNHNEDSNNKSEIKRQGNYYFR